MTPRRIVFVIFDGFQSLDLTGPYEVFQHVARLTGGYRCEIVAPVAGSTPRDMMPPWWAGSPAQALAPAGSRRSAAACSC